MFLSKSQSVISLLTLLLYNFILFTSWVCTSSVPREYGEFKLFQTPVTYDLNTSVSIADDYSGGKTIGYTITAVVAVEPIWSDQETDFLLKFHLETAQLHVWGPHGSRPAPWAAPGAPFYARLTGGAVRAAYLDMQEPRDLLNYKKSIISLFQFRAIDGGNKETDISGVCDVVYESTSINTIYKTKTGCEGDDGEAWWRRSTYALSGALDALRDVRAEERVRLGAGDAALTAHAAHALRQRHTAPPQRHTAPPSAAHAELAHALHDIPPQLEPVALTLLPDTQSSEAVEELPAALAGLARAAEDAAGAGGDAAAAGAALRALPALARASAPALLAALKDPAHQPVLAWLCRLLGLAGSGAALAAAAEHLQLAARDPPLALALHFLAGAALAERATPDARAALLQLAERARAPAVAHAALLAAAAQARRAGPAAALQLKDHVTKALSRCKEDECRIARLHALGNLALAESAEALLWHAERGARGAALAALDALAGLPAAALDAAQRARLRSLAAQPGRAVEVRATALELLLQRAAPGELRALAAALREAPHELRRVFWQRARALADEDPRWEAALRALPAEDLTWHARANAGTSHVLWRSTGWRLGERRARLASAQLAAAGLLRRGSVALRSHRSGDPRDEREELAVEVWTRGLEAVAGGSDAERAALQEGDGAEDGDGVSGGLRLRVGGVHAPGRLLFAGQAELLALLWSGAASEPTPALRAALPHRVRAARRALLAGAELHYRAGELQAFAVDAQAQVSLWSRSARAALELRVAHVGGALAAVAGAARLRAEATAAAEPRLQLEAHLDFYDGVALCVRAQLAAHELRRDAAAQLQAPGARWRRWRRGERAPLAGRTLALGRTNDQTCRHLASADAA